jgi:hypothetical protein
MSNQKQYLLSIRNFVLLALSMLRLRCKRLVIISLAICWEDVAVLSKIAFSVIFIFTLVAVFLLSLSGCSGSVTSGDNPSSPPFKPALPQLDTVEHNSLETAYFALG